MTTIFAASTPSHERPEHRNRRSCPAARPSDPERLARALRGVRAGLLGAALLAAVPAPAAEGPAGSLALRGVNMAGAEFQSRRIPGTYGTDYEYPRREEIDYFLNKGMNAFRLPFRWERLQPDLAQPFVEAELRRLDAVVSHATGRGAHVILDPHNYARYRSKLIGSEEVPTERFAAFWARLADKYRGNPRVAFGLMNEPHGLPASTWRGIAAAAIEAIRGTGAKNLILVPGVAWTGAHSWTGGPYGEPNAVALRGLKDPAGNMAFEVHQYFDRDYSGVAPECRSETIGAEKLRAFTGWLKANGHKGFLGEFGVGPDPTCLAALDGALSYLKDNADVWVGWTYWAAGRRWAKNYPFSVHPREGVDAPQMGVLERHLGGR